MRGISARQLQCMSRVAKGLTSKQIARELGLSPSTVDNHVQAVVERLGVANRLDAARVIVSMQDTRSDPADCIDQTSVHAEDTDDHNREETFKLAQLPTVGGRRNGFKNHARFLYVIQIAFLSTMVFAAITATVAGIVTLFKP
jgi:DNA-binding CsgD family transcriptional regulator